jgi:NAD(P)H-dependent FMN reductase
MTIPARFRIPFRIIEWNSERRGRTAFLHRTRKRPSERDSLEDIVPVVMAAGTRAEAMTPNVAAGDTRAGVRSALIDIAQLALPIDDAGEAIKDERFASAMNHADGLVIVAAEYNHSFPGLLKHVLDSCLQEYVHKAVGLVGVSSGPFAGTRVVQSLLPVMRELGLVTLFWDVNIGQVGKIFDDTGRLLDDALIRRSDKFIRELIWMAKTLRHGREQITIDDEAAETAAAPVCPDCGEPMNHHANKTMPDGMTDSVGMNMTAHALHACPACGAGAAVSPELPVGAAP